MYEWCYKVFISGHFSSSVLCWTTDDTLMTIIFNDFNSKHKHFRYNFITTPITIIALSVSTFQTEQWIIQKIDTKQMCFLVIFSSVFVLRLCIWWREKKSKSIVCNINTRHIYMNVVCVFVEIFRTFKHKTCFFFVEWLIWLETNTLKQYSNSNNNNSTNIFHTRSSLCFLFSRFISTYRHMHTHTYAYMKWMHECSSMKFCRYLLLLWEYSLDSNSNWRCMWTLNV